MVFSLKNAKCRAICAFNTLWQRQWHDVHMIYEEQLRQVHRSYRALAWHDQCQQPYVCNINLQDVGQTKQMKSLSAVVNAATPRSSVGVASISREREREKRVEYEIKNSKIIPKLPVKMPKTKWKRSGNKDEARTEFFVASNQARSLSSWKECTKRSNP